MTVKKLIEKIEGEAELDFSLKNGSVEDVTINFGFYRGIEEIMISKAPRDALVITPRVCGICNHAHLMAAVQAIEHGYAGTGISVELTDKAKAIRDFTLACELIQNHVKWFYLTILPQLEHLTKEESKENHALKASYLSTTITKALAIFAGQWPHSSYAVPGGVTCDPTYVDVMQAQALVDETVRFFEQVMTGISFDAYEQIDSVAQMHEIKGDIGRLLYLLGHYDMAKRGQSHDRFMVLGETTGFVQGKSIATTIANVDVRYVEEQPQSGTTAKAVTYKKRQYEVGPLARAMVAKDPLIRSMHKRYKDSLLTRIFARMHEVAYLLRICQTLLKGLDLRQDSCTLEGHLLASDFEGIGMVEAARGSLIHKTVVKERCIENYEIIVPTQWNLSHGTQSEKGIAVEAMVGSQSMDEASFIFRAFDVCSVCTTQ